MSKACRYCGFLEEHETAKFCAECGKAFTTKSRPYQLLVIGLGLAAGFGIWTLHQSQIGIKP
ncbi:MAG: hypothetical protein KDD62_15465, partial [Bdellovibrionales bacterium]|nr:hypothetical protein [Bdellovibrionales bacterium]